MSVAGKTYVHTPRLAKTTTADDTDSNKLKKPLSTSTIGRLDCFYIHNLKTSTSTLNRRPLQDQ